MKPMRIGIYGGTFDPPHIGHLSAIKHGAEQLKIDRLIIIPAGIPPHKMLEATSSPKEDKKSASEEKEREVHCNFVIRKSIHTRMKYMAIDRDMSLKDMVNEAMKEYLDKYEK